MSDRRENVTPSPFHAGELQVQARLGVEQSVGVLGRKLIRDHLIDQHRAFYSQLPFLMLGTVDDRQRPWASLVVNTLGF